MSRAPEWRNSPAAKRRTTATLDAEVISATKQHGVRAALGVADASPLQPLDCCGLIMLDTSIGG
jgi:hypothetical protein